MGNNNGKKLGLAPIERAVLSARYVCGGLSILVSSITMLATVVDKRTRNRVDTHRAKGDPDLWGAREAMETAFLDYTSILVCRYMDNNRGVLSIPEFCKVVKKLDVRKQIIDIARREHRTENEFDEKFVQELLNQILSEKNKIEKSDEFKWIKEFRNHRAAHSTFKDYGMSISHLMTIYFNLAMIGNHFQTIFGSKVYESDYWDLEPTYRQAAAALWQLETPIDPILFKETVVFKPNTKDI